MKLIGRITKFCVQINGDHEGDNDADVNEDDIDDAGDGERWWWW